MQLLQKLETMHHQCSQPDSRYSEFPIIEHYDIKCKFLRLITLRDSCASYQFLRNVFGKKCTSQNSKKSCKCVSSNCPTRHTPWRLQSGSIRGNYSPRYNKTETEQGCTCAAPRAIVASIERSPHSQKQKQYSPILLSFTFPNNMLIVIKNSL